MKDLEDFSQYTERTWQIGLFFQKMLAESEGVRPGIWMGGFLRVPYNNTVGITSTMHDTTYQLKFWREFTQLKEHALYLNLYQASDNRIEFWKNIILAITSSSAISAWAIWQVVPWLWGAIIAVTHIIQAVSPLLPYKKRLEHLNGLSNEYDGLCIKAEEDWYEIANGRKSDDEIHEMQLRLKKRILEIAKKQLKGCVIPIKKKIEIEAVKQRERYFTNQFS